MALVHVDLTMGAPAASGSLFALSRAYTIREAGGGALVDIFEDADGVTPANNPISAINGELRFFVEEGQSLERVDNETGLIRQFFVVGPGAYAGGGGSGDATTIHGLTIPVPGPDEDGFTWIYDDATGAFIWTELPTGGSDAVEAFQPLDAYLGPGWQDYDDDAVFYKDRERVYFRGVLYYNGGGNPGKPIDNLPVGYRPVFEGARLTIFTNTDSTSVATKGYWWSGFLGTSGDLDLHANPAFAASPNFGAPPVGTTFDLESVNFRIS